MKTQLWLVQMNPLVGLIMSQVEGFYRLLQMMKQQKLYIRRHSAIFLAMSTNFLVGFDWICIVIRQQKTQCGNAALFDVRENPERSSSDVLKVGGTV